MNKFFQKFTEDEIKDVVEEDDDTFGDSEWSIEEIEKASKENITNQKNEEEFHNVMDGASRNLDGYWDKNNLLIRLITYFLFVFAILGVLYYLVIWFSNN